VLDLETLLDEGDKTNPYREPEPDISEYKIVGTILGTDTVQTVTASFANHCVFDSCGVSPRQYLPKMLILYEKDSGLHGDTGPCGGSVFPLPTSEQRAALEHCLSEGKCDPDDETLENLVGSIR